MVDLEQLYSSLLERLGPEGHLEVLTSQSYKRAVRRGQPLGDLKPVKLVWIRSYPNGSTSVKQSERFDTLTAALMSVNVWLDEDDRRLGVPVKPPPPDVAPRPVPTGVPPGPDPLPPKPKFSLGQLVSKKKK